ncbi:MAG: RNA pseudouridine synthase [Clostridiales bacterium]|nr:RNA pseudouridine synthase [Clostridiales bacterium]
MELLYVDEAVVVCIKPARVLSTDEPGGLPELVRQALGNPKADIRTVHRLDRVVSGVMVLARNAAAASELSRQMRENLFQKEYLAVVHGVPEDMEGTLTDLLYRDKARRMTMVAKEPGKDVRQAVLDYRVLGTSKNLSKVLIRLHTGRTHQIRVQFASRGMPLVGERKYSEGEDSCEIALWSHKVSFDHPTTGESVEFSQEPPRVHPWTLF